MIKVSVIVPVYNTAQYLPLCMDSLTQQTLQDIEIIVVNDGSTDDSRQILDRYSYQFANVRVLDKENGGLSDARNYGLAHAQGEYVGFIDSDDYVDTDMFERMYEKAKETDSDICECNLHHTFEDYEDTEIGAELTDPKELLMNGRSVVWNKIYRRCWLEETGVIFHKGIIYEDVEFYCKLVPYINRIVYIPEACVHYVQRGDSINHDASYKTLDIMRVLAEIAVYYREKGFWEEYHDALEYLFARIILCSSFSRICSIKDRRLREDAIWQSWRFLMDIFPDWKKNPYILSSKSWKIRFARTMNGYNCKYYGVLLSGWKRYRKRGRAA